MISGLGKRVFLLHNVHEDRPVLFQTRWAMSYLAGPVTREQIRMLEPEAPGIATPVEKGPVNVPVAAPETEPVKEVLPTGVVSFFAPEPQGKNAEYAPFLGGFARIHFRDSKLGVSETRSVAFVTEMNEGPLPIDWENAFEIEELDPSSLMKGVPSQVMSLVPAAAHDPKAYTKWSRDFLKWLPNNSFMKVLTCPPMKEAAKPGESRADFAARLALSRREQRDAAIEKIRKKYASKLTTLQNRLLRAEQSVERESEQVKHKKMETFVSFGTAIAGTLLGRKANVYSASRLGTAVSRAARLNKEKGDVSRAKERAESVSLEIEQLESQLEEEINGTGFGEALEMEIQESIVRAKASDISLLLFGILWLPYARNPQGGILPLWKMA